MNRPFTKKFLRFVISLAIPVWVVFFICFALFDAIEDDAGFMVASSLFDTWCNWIKFKG